MSASAFSRITSTSSLTRPSAQGDELPEAGPLQHAIELRDVWFRYRPDMDWVLRGVNVRLAAGQTHALVGLNGAGKSTLVRLLLRYYEPSHGQILWDGVDIKSLDVHTLRKRITGVLQDYVAYELSALENITIGDMSRLGDEPAARSAAGRAKVLDAIEALPSGFQTMLSPRRNDDRGEVGIALSGGQWQRVVLARAMMRVDADLMILDEPNAGLDAAAEFALHADLMALGVGRTRLLISHRLGGLRGANQIIVLDHGMVVETGTHDQLIRAGGGYADLFELQASGYSDVEMADQR